MAGSLRGNRAALVAICVFVVGLGLWNVAHYPPRMGYDAGEDLPRVKDCLREPANLGAALGYYRALFDPSRQVPELAKEQAATQAPTPQPTLYLHGVDDGCMGAELVDEKAVLGHLGPESQVALVPRSGHFVHLEQPEAVNRLVLDFVSGP